MINPNQGAGILCDADGTYIGMYLGNNGATDSIFFYNYDTNDDYFGMDYTLNTWFHIALVHSGGQLKAYKNGVLFRTIASGTTGYVGTRALEMGFNLFSGVYFDGELDEVTTFNRGLNSTEIINVMKMNTTGVNGMTGYWQMSNCDEQHFYNPLNHIADSLGGVSCNISGVPNFIGTETITQEYSSMQLYPNPSNSIVNIQLKNIEPEFLFIYDITGRVVYQSNINANDLITLNLENLHNGIYSVQVIDTNRKVYILRFIRS